MQKHAQNTVLGGGYLRSTAKNVGENHAEENLCDISCVLSLCDPENGREEKCGEGSKDSKTGRVERDTGTGFNTDRRKEHLTEDNSYLPCVVLLCAVPK